MRAITREELKEMIDRGDGVRLMDARAHDAFEAEHLPGAVSMPSDHIGPHALSGLSRSEKVVTYCSSFKCEASEIAARKLEKYGFEQVLRFEGGLKDWKEAGYPTER